MRKSAIHPRRFASVKHEIIARPINSHFACPDDVHPNEDIEWNARYQFHNQECRVRYPGCIHILRIEYVQTYSVKMDTNRSSDTLCHGFKNRWNTEKLQYGQRHCRDITTRIYDCLALCGLWFDTSLPELNEH